MCGKFETSSFYTTVTVKE